MAPPSRSLFSFLALATLAHSMPSQHPMSFEPENKDAAVIVQMFERSWSAVAQECKESLGPAGYGFVQLSPAQEHVVGPQWWTDYQPVSYSLTSKRGNRTEFEHLVETCHAAGVGVIADTLWNHMAGAESGYGVGGSKFTHYNYPGIYQYQDFHHCTYTKSGDIEDYSNAQEVWTCQLEGLADLATDTEYVRGRLAEYTNDLLSLGVDGLRLDASKHINPDDIANISSRLTRQPYITQEVIYGDNEGVRPDMYTKNGDVQEFRYATTLKWAYLQGGISSLQDLDNRGWVAGWGANVFVSNHDTERNGNSLNAYSPSNAFTLATVFSLAHPYGTPTVLSSYSFSNTDDGAPYGGAGSCWDLHTKDGSAWFCQHRWPAIAGMVGFRNHVGSAPLTGWVSPSSQQIAFSRGSRGFVAINNQDNVWSGTFTTGLPTGWYCNVIDGPYSEGKCSGTAFWIAVGGGLTATIGPQQAIAVHTGAPGTANPAPETAHQVSVLFYEDATTTPGENVFVVGNVPQLGNWDPSKAILLDATGSYPTWRATVYLPPNTSFQYKFIRKETDGRVVWESDPNRQYTTTTSNVQFISTSWR